MSNPNIDRILFVQKQIQKKREYNNEQKNASIRETLNTLVEGIIDCIYDFLNDEKTSEETFIIYHDYLRSISNGYEIDLSQLLKHPFIKQSISKDDLVYLEEIEEQLDVTIKSDSLTIKLKK